MPTNIPILVETGQKQKILEQTYVRSTCMICHQLVLIIETGCCILYGIQDQVKKLSKHNHWIRSMVISLFIRLLQHNISPLSRYKLLIYCKTVAKSVCCVKCWKAHFKYLLHQWFPWKLYWTVELWTTTGHTYYKCYILYTFPKRLFWTYPLFVPNLSSIGFLA